MNFSSRDFLHADTTDLGERPAEPAVSDKPKRRWFQFSLKTLCAALVVASVTFGIWKRCIEPAEQQRAIVRRVESVGGAVGYAEPPKSESPLVHKCRDLLPRDYFDMVVHIDLGSSQLQGNSNVVDDDVLRGFGHLKMLETVTLDLTSVTDDGLEQLRSLINLQKLNISGTPVTDAGLKHLERLSRLEELDLNSTAVTDAGLIHLRNLHELRKLVLYRTSVGDSGLIYLRELPKLAHLNLAYTPVRDAGLVHLRSKKSLVSTDGPAMIRFGWTPMLPNVL